MYRFEHTNAFTVDEAAKILGEENALVIAGGTDLLTTMKSMCIPNPPDLLVNIKTIPDMDRIYVDNNDALRIGALATLTDIADNADVKSGWQVLAEAALKVGSPELRNKGTIGGNICQRPRCIYFRKEYNLFNCLRKKGGVNTCYAKDGTNRYHSIFGAVGSCFAVCPSDTAPALVALNATIVTNKKEWPADEFFYVGDRDDQINDIDEDEIVKEIVIPKLDAGTKSTYLKFAFRKAIDFPLVSVAAVVTSSGGNVTRASIVLGGVYNVPKRASEAEDYIVGKAINDNNADTAGAEGVKNNRASEILGAKYKVQVTKTLIKRALLALR